MFDEFQALAALKKHGTLALAGAHLRVEASTVWKRIQSLEKSSSKKLLEKKGRNAFLTPQAEKLLQRAEPHIDALREILRGNEDKDYEKRRLRIGLSESIALSWGPKLLKDLLGKESISDIELSTHRGSLLIEKLHHGDFDFVICAGTNNPKTSLLGQKVFEEEMIYFRSTLESKVYCIEESALSFEWLKDEISSVLNSIRKTHEIVYLQSYGAIASLISAGLAGGIVPHGIAKKFRLPMENQSKLNKKIYRPIYVYSKKSFYTSETGNRLYKKAAELSKVEYVI